RDQRRPNALFRETHMAVSASTAHLRPIGGQPTYFQPFAHAHLGEQLSEQQHPLASEAGYLDGHLLKVMGVVRNVRSASLFFRSDLKNVADRALRRIRTLRNFQLAITEYIQGKSRNHFFSHPLARFYRILSPNGWARGQNLHA